MNWDAIGAIGEILGAVAVLITLVYLAKQISNSNRIAIASNEIQLRNSFGNLNQAIYSNPEIADLLTRSQLSNSEFDPTELTKLTAFFRQVLNSWLSVELTYSNGMAPEETYRAIFNNITEAVETFPAVGPIFRELIATYAAMGESKVFTFLSAELEKRESGT